MSDPTARAAMPSRPELRASLSELFEPAWYVANHPEARAVGADPLSHFLDVGARVGCDPHPLFDVAWYRARYPEVDRDGCNPLVHYVEHRAARRLHPHPLFDATWYAETVLGAGADDVLDVDPLLHFLREGAARGAAPNALFDAEWYRRRNADVGDGPLAPILHYVFRMRERAAGRAFHFDRREDATPTAPEAYPAFERTREAPCALWRTWTRLFAATPAVPGMEDPLANPVQAYHALCRPETAPHAPEIAFAAASRPQVSVLFDVSPSLPNTVAGLRALASAKGFARMEVHLVVTDESRAACLKRIGAIRGANVVDGRGCGTFARAMARTAAETPHRYVAFVGCGAVVTDGWLDALLESFDGFRDVGLAGSPVLAPSASPSSSSPARVVHEGDPDAYGALLLPSALLREIGGVPETPRGGLSGALADRVRARGRCVVRQAASVVAQFPDAGGYGKPAAATAATGRSRALVVDVCTPTPGRDARSLRLFRVMELLRESGFDVTFVPANLDAPASERRTLRSRGFRVVARPDAESLQGFLERSDERFALCWISRPNVAERVLADVRRALPDARLVFDAVDLLSRDELRRTARLGPGGGRTGDPAPWRAADAIVVDPAHANGLRDELEAASGFHVVPKIFAPPRTRTSGAERLGALFVPGFQHAAGLDALLWLLDEILPRVLAADASVRLYVPANDWSGAFTRTHRLHPHLVPVDEGDLQSPLFVDHFRAVVAPFRFGAGVPGQLQAALARGVPCVATPVASAGLASDARGPGLALERADAIAAAIARLCGGSADATAAWEEASRAAERAVARVSGVDEARAALSRLVDALGVSPGRA